MRILSPHLVPLAAFQFPIPLTETHSLPFNLSTPSPLACARSHIYQSCPSLIVSSFPSRSYPPTSSSRSSSSPSLQPTLLFCPHSAQYALASHSQEKEPQAVVLLAATCSILTSNPPFWFQTTRALPATLESTTSRPESLHLFPFSR